MPGGEPDVLQVVAQVSSDAWWGSAFMAAVCILCTAVAMSLRNGIWTRACEQAFMSPRRMRQATRSQEEEEEEEELREAMAWAEGGGFHARMSAEDDASSRPHRARAYDPPTDFGCSTPPDPVPDPGRSQPPPVVVQGVPLQRPAWQGATPDPADPDGGCSPVSPSPPLGASLLPLGNWVTRIPFGPGTPKRAQLLSDQSETESGRRWFVVRPTQSWPQPSGHLKVGVYTEAAFARALRELPPHRLQVLMEECASQDPPSALPPVVGYSQVLTAANHLGAAFLGLKEYGIISAAEIPPLQIFVC